ncbi:MAG: hypothetical protein FWD96_06560, partial [Defluviitaleaceae bacterium]|nr:hypothetical protein [Defluviitaleaceae bacterium]
MRRAHIANAFIAVVMFSLVYANYQYYVIPSRFLQSVGAASQLRQGADISHLYTFHIDIAAESPGSANTYLPRYEPMDESTAERLFAAFGITGNIIETDEVFFASDDYAMITVYKFDRTLRYMPYFQFGSPCRSIIDHTKAEELAREFISQRAIYTPHHKIEADFDGTNFQLTFVNRLGGLKNYSFNTHIHMDSYGRVLEFVYSDMTFERLSTHSIIPMQQAATLLP